MQALLVCDIVRMATNHVRSRDVLCSCWLLIWVKYLCLFIIKVLSRVRGLVLQHLYEAVKSYSDAGTKDRTEPVNPMVAGEVFEDYARTERACRVEGTTCEVDT